MSFLLRADIRARTTTRPKCGEAGRRDRSRDACITAGTATAYRMPEECSGESPPARGAHDRPHRTAPVRPAAPATAPRRTRSAAPRRNGSHRRPRHVLRAEYPRRPAMPSFKGHVVPGSGEPTRRTQDTPSGEPGTKHHAVLLALSICGLRSYAGGSGVPGPVSCPAVACFGRPGTFRCPGGEPRPLSVGSSARTTGPGPPAGRRSR